MGWIYIATSPSGKSYIGQTKRAELWVRLREHCYLSSRRAKDIFYEAICKYGRWDPKNKTIANFAIDFYECPNDDLNFDETFMIQMMETLAPAGYNLARGGPGAPSKQSKETIKKRVDKLLGHEVSEKTRRLISESNKGKVITEQHRLQNKTALSGRVQTDTHIQARCIAKKVKNGHGELPLYIKRYQDKRAKKVHGYAIVLGKVQKVITVPITEPLSYALKMSKYYLMAMQNPMSM